MPSNAPTDFIKSRWNSVVFKNDGQIDKIFYEFAVASELKNALRSGDLWVSGSKQYKDFEEYLIDPKTYKECLSNEILLGVTSYDFKEWIAQKTDTLTTLLTQVNQEAKENRLIDAIINEKGLKISPLTASVPEEARNFIQKVYAMLPKIKVTALLQEVDEWISFSDSFTHLKTRNIAENKQLLLSVILADAINLGLSREVASLFFRLISKRYEKSSTIITSNKEFQEWGQIFNDDVIATAILDRLLHHSHPLLINGPSYRMKDLLPKTKKKQNLEDKNNEI